MIKKFKKAVALFMVLVLAFSLMVVNVYTGDDDGYGYDAGGSYNMGEIYSDSGGDYYGSLLVTAETITPSALAVYSPSVVIYNLGCVDND